MGVVQGVQEREVEGLLPGVGVGQKLLMWLAVVDVDVVAAADPVVVAG